MRICAADETGDMMPWGLKISEVKRVASLYFPIENMLVPSMETIRVLVEFFVVMKPAVL
jgi:hypothetical protein